MKGLIPPTVCAILVSIAGAGWTGLAARDRKPDGLDVAVGKALFDRNWVPAPSSTNGSDGLGPLFNARSCNVCHKGGGPSRAAPKPDGKYDLIGAVVRLGGAKGETDPVFGQQIQDQAVSGFAPEARVTILPKLTLELTYGSLAPGIHAGVRGAPSLFGRSGFDDISDDEIRAGADPNDSNGDGISGHVRELTDNSGTRLTGRFGWKASHATLSVQISHAFAIDIGLSSPPMPYPYGDCTDRQTACRALPNGESALFDGREISNEMIRVVATYVASLKVPRTVNPVEPGGEDDANAGAQLFMLTGCAACHKPALSGKDGQPVRTFSDLLLHDMGAGLDDGVGEPGAASNEWRTAPLIALDPRSGSRRYLHDGRAETIEQAIEAHDGEAAKSRTTFDSLTKHDKEALLAYLRQL